MKYVEMHMQCVVTWYGFVMCPSLVGHISLSDQSINQMFPGVSYTKIYYVSVSEEVIRWDIIGISNGTTINQQYLYTTLFQRFWMIILNMIKETNLENSPF